ncbi:MAG: amino acid ABC transporter permease [Paracoccaceae bacterium]|nr:amino acid ABC transporter permease [Paracoccaceae bacterium]MDE2915331.1 amino acid ABC transporter permease [Paracoccaceae bacterium]
MSAEVSFGRKVRRDFFATPLDSVITLAFSALLIYLLYGVLSWGIFNAIWGGDSADVCRADGAKHGACWTVINVRWRLILFGLYPYEEQWRSAIACMVILVTAVLSCIPYFWTGKRLALTWISGFAAFYLLMKGGILGLPLVVERDWGGLSLTVFIFSSVAMIGMPMSIVIALMRRSKLPLIARPTAFLIDVTRSLPLLSIMFTAAVVIPFVLPQWLQGDKLYRIIIGFAIFFAAYQAEIIRGGFQAVPSGQEEASAALGLNYWQNLWYIMLPQVFRAALPPTINQFVITFKETSLVVLIGFFEVLASGAAAFGTAEWKFAYKEVYVFVGLIFFVFVLSLSRYGAYLERRLSVEQR